MKKTLWSLLTVLALTFAVSSCEKTTDSDKDSGTEQTPEDGGNTSGEGSGEEPDVNVPAQQSKFFMSASDDIEDRLDKTNSGIKVLLTDSKFYADASLNELFDHADSSPSSPLKQPAGSLKWFSPYHGKAAPAGATLSSVAQSAGWSSEIWDFSGSVPVLK